MNLSHISSSAIRSPIPTSVLFLVLTILGLVSFRLLPINATPNITFPMVTVTVAQAGAAPSELETQVTQRVEGAIAGLTDVKHVQSIVSDGVSMTTVEFQLGMDPDRATNDVRDAVSRIRSDLPTDIEEPIVKRVEVEGGAILTFAIEAPHMPMEALSWYIDDTLSRELLAVPGVSQISRLGGVDREIRVELDPVRLMAFGVTAAEINRQLRALNIDLPGGRSDIGAREQLIRTLGEAESVARLQEAGLQLSGGRWIRLRDVAHVSDTAAEQRTLARFNGKPVVAFSVYRARGSSEVNTGEAVRAKVSELQQRLPGIRISEIASTVDYTRTSYTNALHTLIEGMVLAALVVLWFLRDMRATLISAVAMPLSVLPTFAAMHALGFTLNGVSLLALTLVIGILVDDAIVEIENIVRHMRGGKRPYPAAIEAADEIGLAVVATTMSIVVVFLPVSFLGGIVGQYFREFGITVAVAVFASLMVARLLTPLLSAYFLKPHDANEKEPAWLTRYTRALRWSLEHRGWTLLMGIGFFALSLALVPFLPTAFIPEEDRSQSMLSVELPPGAAIAETDRTGRRITELLRQRAEVKDVFYAIGTAGDKGEPGELRKLSFIINLVKPGERELSQKQFEAQMRRRLAELPDLRASFSGGVSGGREVSILLTGDDAQALYDTARQLELQMRGLPQVTNVLSNVPLPRPELIIRPRSDEAAALGISVADIAQTVRIATQGDIDAASAKFTLGDRQVPIRVLLPMEARTELDTLRQLRVTGMVGTVPLSSVADIYFGNGEVRIDRFDRERRVSVEADLNGTTLGEALTAVYQLPALTKLPAGVRLQQYGESEYMAEMFSQFGMAMGAGILMIYAVLVLLFKDFLHPGTILTALPLSVGGALLALLITGQSLDMPSMIGLIMLMGIVTKNAILLVDYAIESERAGQEPQDALMDAGHKRARPIVMTTIAMVAGMLPAAIGLGEGAEFRAPMAIGVIGGLLTSTLLSLVFVPVIYSYIDQFRNWAEPKLARLTTVAPEDKQKEG